MHYIILNVHTVCDVIIPRSCGTLPSFTAKYFCLLWSVWCSWCLKIVVYYTLRLDSDLKIRIQRKLCSDTTTFSFLLCKANLTKLFAIHRWCWTSGVHFSISAEGVNFVFWPSQRARQLLSVQSTLHLEICDEMIKIYKLKQVSSFRQV